MDAIFAEETAGLDVRFYAKHIDISELPSAYKDAQSVQKQMREFGLGEVVDEIEPYGCIMAGDWQADAPWRKRRQRNEARRSARLEIDCYPGNSVDAGFRENGSCFIGMETDSSEGE